MTTLEPTTTTVGPSTMNPNEFSLNTSLADQFAEFDSVEFLKTSIPIAIPFFLLFIPAALFFHFAIKYKVSRIRSFLAKYFSDADKFNLWGAKILFGLALVLLVVLPVLLLLVWAVVVASSIPPATVGATIGLCGLVVISLWYGIGLWGSLGWRMTNVTLGAIGVAFFTYCVYAISITVLVRPFTYIGFSAVFLSFNLFPMIYIVYLNAPGRRVDFAEYIKKELPDDTMTLAAPDLTIKKSRRFRTIVAYFLSVLILIVYAGLLAFFEEEEAGFLTLIAVLVLDLTLCLNHLGGGIRNPQTLSLLMIIIRAALILATEDYWFIGHCIVFFFTVSIFALYTVDYRIPRTGTPITKRQKALADPIREIMALEDDLGVDLTELADGTLEDGNAPDDPTVNPDVVKKTGVAKYLLSREFIIALLTIFFVADTALAFVFNDKLLQVKFTTAGEPHKQWVYGIAAIVMTLLTPFTFSVFRLYQNNNYHADKKVAVLVGVTEVAWAGSGLAFKLIADSDIILILSIFVPAIFGLVGVCYFQWILNDYRLFSLKDEREGENAEKNFFAALFTGGLLRKDYLMVSGLVLSPILMLVMCFLLQESVNAEVAWSIGAAISIPFLTYVPIAKYFNTFELKDPMMITSAILSQFLVVVYAGLMFVLYLESQADVRALGLLYSVVLYPTLTVLVVTIRKWKDDGWEANKKVYISMGICFGVMLIFVVLTIFAYKPISIGLGVLGAYVLFVYFVALGIAWVKNGFYLKPIFKYSGVIVVILVIGAGVAGGLGTRNFFIGFTVSWGSIFVVLFFWLLSKYLRTKSGVVHTYQYSRFIFPVYKYHPESGEVMTANQHAILVYTTLLVAMVWGINAALFLTPFWIGFGVSSVCIVLIYTYTLDRLWQPHITFGRALQYVTPELLAEARAQALQKQIGSAYQTVEAAAEAAGAGGSSSDITSDARAPAAQTAVAIGVAGENISAADWQKTIKARETSLKAGEGIESVAGEDLGPVKGWVGLLEYDRELNEAYQDEQRFAALFQLLTVMLTDGKRRDKEVLIRELLRETDYKDVTAEQINKWSDGDKAAFRHAIQAYLREKGEKEARSRANAEADAEADRRRQEMLREAEERRRAEENEHFAEALRLEQERKRQMEAQRDAERTAAEAAAVEAARAAEEARRIAEERARLEAMEATLRAQREAELRAEEEAERQRAEEEARRAAEAARAIEEARARQEAAARQAAEARRLAEDADRQREAAAAAAGDPDIAAQIAALGSREFVDEEFPANDRSLYITGRPNGARAVHGWARIPDLADDGAALHVFAPSEGQAGEPSIDPTDIQQGMLGDCWFLSAISVLATQEERVRNVFITKEANEPGLYAVKFFKNGKWKTVVVDDKMPTSQNGRLAYGHSQNTAEMWVPLIEKAYAKLHNSYEAIEGGLVHMALVDLTGGSSETFNMEEAPVRREIASGRMWERLLQYRQANYLMGAGSPAGVDTDVSAHGIVQGHAYGLLDVQEIDGNKLVKLRNPWGEQEWNGDWSDDSPLWTRRMKAKLNVTSDNDGEFWMSLDDFSRHFKNIYVCRLFDDGIWNETHIDSEWRGETAGGCPNFPTAVNNPQFFLTLTRPTKLFISLAQEETRGTGRDDLHIGFMVVDKKGKRVRRLFKGQRVANSGQYINRREVSCEITLEPKSYPYTIFPSAFNAGDEARFTLTVHSDYPVTLEAIPTSVEAE